MTTRWLLVSGCVCGLVWLGTVAVEGAKRLKDVPVSVTLRDFSTDGIRSDGGVYTNGVENVSANLLANSSGNFVFDTNGNSGLDGGRRFVIDLHDPSSATFPDPFEADVFLGSLVVDSNDPNNLLEMSVGGPDRQRRARLNWVIGKLQYYFRWNSDGLESFGFLNFHCELGSPCTSWTVTPTGPAGLYSIATKNGATETYIGTYDIQFSMTLDKLP